MTSSSKIIHKILNFTLTLNLTEFLIKFWSRIRLILDFYQTESEKVLGPKFDFDELKCSKTWKVILLMHIQPDRELLTNSTLNDIKEYICVVDRSGNSFRYKRKNRSFSSVYYAWRMFQKCGVNSKSSENVALQTSRNFCFSSWFSRSGNQTIIFFNEHFE